MPSSTVADRTAPPCRFAFGSSRRCRRAALAAIASVVVVAAGGAAQATADGPDHYRVRGVAPGHHLTLRAEPSTASASLARIPSNATCLRSFGCQGGLTFEDGISAAGRYVEMRALMDVVVLVSNCPQLNNPCNAYNPTPVRMLIWD